MFPELLQFRHVRLDKDATVKEPPPRVQLLPVQPQGSDEPHCLCLQPEVSEVLGQSGSLVGGDYEGNSGSAEVILDYAVANLSPVLK